MCTVSTMDGKEERYAALNQCHIFTPVAIETAGPFRPETFSFLRDLGCRLKQVTGEAKSFSYLRQHLSVTVQRGNATAVMGTMGGTTPSVDFCSWLPFLLWGALSASPWTIWLFLCVFMLLLIIILFIYIYNYIIQILNINNWLYFLHFPTSLLRWRRKGKWTWWLNAHDWVSTYSMYT